MRLARRNWILLICALLLLVLDWSTRPQGPESVEAVPLFPAMEGAQAMRVEIIDPAQEQGQPLLLSRATGEELERAPGLPWRLEGRQGWPAGTSKATRLLDWITNLNTADRLSGEAASHGDYGLLEADALRVRVLAEDGAVLADLLQGDMAPGGMASYVRRLGDDDVWRAPRALGRVPASMDVWIEPRWLPFERSAVVVSAVELEGSGMAASLRLERAEGSLDLWRGPDGELVSAAQVRALLEGLEALVVSDVRAGDELRSSLDSPTLRVRLERLDGGEPWSGTFGEVQAGERIPATRGAGDWIVTFPASAVKPLLLAAAELAQS